MTSPLATISAKAAANVSRGEYVPGEYIFSEPKTGPGMIRDEDGRLSGYVYVDVSGRDIGSYIADAKNAVRKKVSVPAGYQLVWCGQYENMRRVKICTNNLVSGNWVLLPITPANRQSGGRWPAPANGILLRYGMRSHRKHAITSQR